MIKQLTILSVFIIGMWSCSESSDTTNPADPSNLSVEIEVLDDKSGDIEIMAIADNATEYEFNLGDGNIVANPSGILNYTYSASGIYAIEIRAYGTSGSFQRKEYTITVIVGDDIPGFNPDGYTTPLSYDGMDLIWQDEFSGIALNQSFWNFEIGNGSGGWGNNELQYYRSENTTVSDGYLTIEARQENFSGFGYTSSRLTTENKFDFNYGRVDIRATLPEGQGIWPALWMLGRNIRTVGWPACGEIDVMELVGHQPSTVHGTVHFGPPWPNNQYTGEAYSISGKKFADEFHVFSLIWSENKIDWYVNDVHYLTITPSNTAGFNWPFNEEFFFIFNVAVGGNWPGSPNGSTVFPQQMVVDYIRVFQEN